MITTQDWVVEWSERQKQFHMEEAWKRLGGNVWCFLNRRSRSEWLTLCVCATMEEASEVIQELALRRGLVWDEEMIKWREDPQARGK